MTLNKLKYTDFTSHLLTWYDSRNLDFPWRRSNDPYKIYLSEVMLQQTQIKTALPYYQRWIKKYRTPQSVANATQEQILKQWEGLGYYTRARNFHKSCQIISSKYNGVIPASHVELSKLPGVGPYISAAVVSIAFRHSLPAIDTNAVRVTARLQLIDASSPSGLKKIHKYLVNNIANKRPGDFNQAIMDLGREICKLKNPACQICPVANFCKALANNSIDKYPIKRKRTKKPHYDIAVGIIWKKDSILISKRRENGFLGGLWEFPGGKIEVGEGPKNCIIREIKEELGVCVQPVSFLKRIEHTYTHFTVTMYAYNCNFLHGQPQALGCDDWRWIRPEQITMLPFPRANHKLFDKIINTGIV